MKIANEWRIQEANNDKDIWKWKLVSHEQLSIRQLMLKLQYFGHLMWRTDSLEKTLMLGKIEAGGEGDDRG